MENHKNFTVGDHVFVGDIEDIRHCCHGCNNLMFKYANREATITKADPFGYLIDIDDGEWAWCDKTLFSANPEGNPDLEPADDLFALFGGSL